MQRIRSPRPVALRERKRERGRERPPSELGDLLQLVGVCRPAGFPSLFLFTPVFSLILYFLPGSSISPVRMPMEEQRKEKETDCHAQKPRRHGGNVLLAVTFDRSTFQQPFAEPTKNRRIHYYVI